MNTQLLEQARKLSIEDRIELVEAIWDTVHDSPADVSLSPAHIAFLEERLAAYEADPSAGAPWEVVRSRLERLG